MSRSDPTEKYTILLRALAIYQREWTHLREGLTEIRVDPEHAREIAEVYLRQASLASSYDKQVEAITGYLRQNQPRIESSRNRQRRIRGSYPVPSTQLPTISDEEYEKAMAPMTGKELEEYEEWYRLYGPKP